MFDLGQFLAECVDAQQETEPRRAVKEVLTRAMSRPEQLELALPPRRAGIERLHVSPELTVLNVVWAPGMQLYPHDHRMWAAIGIYGGQEDNVFYRRGPDRIAASGAKELRVRDVVLLGDDTIHSVTNPTTRFTGAIHVYGGDFFAQPRSEWDPVSLVESPYDVEHAIAQFEAANAALEQRSAETAGAPAGDGE